MPGASAVARQDASLGLVKVVGGLQSPVHVTAAPGVSGALYVVEQGGLVRVVRSGKVQAQPFLDVRSKVRAGGEQGLLGLAFAPDYEKSRQFVVNYTDVNGDTRVVRYRSDGSKALPLSARQLLFVKQPYANHNGGMVAYGKDGLVYVGMGDGGSGGDPEERAQNPVVAARQDASPRPVAARGKARHRRARRPQPVAVLVRPCERRPLDR